MTTPKTETTQGKTLADFLDGLLNQPKKFLYFSLMILCLGLVIVSIYFLLLKVTKGSGLNPSEVQFSALGSVRFESTVNGKKQYLVVVRPQGWQPTKISVKAGEHLTFAAAGRVSIDLHSLIDAAQTMYELEQKEKGKIDFSQPAESQKAPEDFFDQDPDTKQRYQKLKSNFPSLWAEPDGLRDENRNLIIEDKDYPGRTKNKAIPNDPYGALIGAITASQPLDNKEFFLIGKELGPSWTAPAGGDLWLNINDVIDKSDRLESRLYYFDNIGFFWVQITMED